MTTTIQEVAEHWRAQLEGNGDGRTHWEGCDLDHWGCALLRLARAVPAIPALVEAENALAIQNSYRSTDQAIIDAALHSVRDAMKIADASPTPLLRAGSEAGR